MHILQIQGVEKSRLEGNEATFLYQALIPPILPSSSAAEQNGAIDDTRQILKGKIRPELMQMLRGLSSYLVPASSSSSSSSCSKLVLLDDLSLVEGIYGQDQTIPFIQSCRGLIQSAKVDLCVLHAWCASPLVLTSLPVRPSINLGVSGCLHVYGWDRRRGSSRRRRRRSIIIKSLSLDTLSPSECWYLIGSSTIEFRI